MNANAHKFTEIKTMALFGASVTKKKFGNTILKELTKRGIKVYPVHLTAERIDGIKTCPMMLPPPVFA